MSKKVLFIKGTPATSSKKVAEEFVEAYRIANPNDEIVEKDLFEVEIPYIDTDILSGWSKYAKGEVPTEIEASKVSTFAAFTEEFLAADKLIIQSTMWNLSIPSQLKSYLDTLMVAGKTFEYTENGPKGLATNKKAIHIHGAGGVYSNTTGIEHSDSYVTGILKFIGMEVVPTIWVEGTDANPEKKGEIINKAITKAKEVAPTF